jgi:hypothetical protein
MGEVMSAQGKEMSEIKSNLAALSTQMAAMMEEVKKNRIIASPLLVGTCALRVNLETL